MMWVTSESVEHSEFAKEGRCAETWSGILASQQPLHSIG